MPASVIDRFGTSTLRPDGVTGKNRRNELMEMISRNSRRLRGGQYMGSQGHILASVANADSFEGIFTRLGVIPIVATPPTASLSANVQAFPAARSGEGTISVAGGSAPVTFAKGDPMKADAFAAAGNGQAVTATSSLDASAKGRALVDILP